MVYTAPEQPEKTATAFRTAEKHFQHLFKDPHASNARSRRRAQALQQAKCASADLTQHGVVDVRQPAAVAAGLEQRTLQRYLLPCAVTLMAEAEPAAAAKAATIAKDCNESQAQHACQSSQTPPSHACDDQGVLAYTLPAHPGFVLLAALLPVAHQLQLMCDALTRFAEPPATTNHNRQYGPLTGVWAAAQSGLMLKLGRQPENGACSNGEAREGNDAHTHYSQLEHEPKQRQQQQQQQQQHESLASGCIYAQQQQQQQQQQHESLTRGFWDCWHRPGTTAEVPNTAAHSSSDGQPSVGPSAASMLRRMRWASLGPQFDWTRRIYDDGTAHRPLPPSLDLLARRTANLVQQLTHLHSPQATQSSQEALRNSDGNTVGRASMNGVGHGCTLQTSCQSKSNGLDGCTQQDWAGSQLHDCQQQQQQQDMHASRTYQPDAALVNYYYEGDTLGGPCDDVEMDLAQPIVAASLGCDAVFLMGGPTRDTAPTPLLLRSGDVVVLGGSARNCFHGVPRVFTERPLPFSPEALDTLPHSLLSGLSASVAQLFPAELLRRASSSQPEISAPQQSPIEVPRPTEVQRPNEVQRESRMGATGLVNPSHCAARMPLVEADSGNHPKENLTGDEGSGTKTDVCKAKQVLLPVLRHMQCCRINISVRAVR